MNKILNINQKSLNFLNQWDCQMTINYTSLNSNIIKFFELVRLYVNYQSNIIKACVRCFSFFHQRISLEKLRKVLFISSKTFFILRIFKFLYSISLFSSFSLSAIALRWWSSLNLKGYLPCKMITSQNVSSKVQIKNFFIS